MAAPRTAWRYFFRGNTHVHVDTSKRSNIASRKNNADGTKILQQREVRLLQVDEEESTVVTST